MATIGYTTFAIIFGLLVHEAVIQESKIITRVLTSKILKFFGTISYSLYIIHWPLNLILRETVNKRLADLIPALSSSKLIIITAGILTLGAIVISFCFYHLFERQFLRLKNAFV
jgi:peptidoglycan/LPS O-acetylase OafA/YrhL